MRFTLKIPQTTASTVLLCSLLLVGLLMAVPAAAQSAPQTHFFSETVDVRVVNLEAAVTHKRGSDRGQHVEGLRAEDFVLEVDGREVPIEYFTEVRGGLAFPESDPGSASGSGSSAAVPALPAGEPVPNRILVFVDNYYSIAARRDAVLRRLEQQLAELGTNDYLAVVTYDGTSVEMVSSWTREHEEIRRALQEVSEMPAYGLHRRSDFARLQTMWNYGGAMGSDVTASTTSSFSSIGFRGAQREARANPGLRTEVRSQVSRIALAATSALRGFARPEGRKTLLLLSGGLPMVGDLDLGAGGGGLGAGEPGTYGTWWSGVYGDRKVLAPLVDTANRLGYTIYPVDLGTSASAGLPSATVATLEESTRLSNFQRELDFESEDSLIFLARSTGGEAYLNSARFIALRRTLDDTRSYYWIGFTPTWREDDGLHRVELKARPRGIDVRTRDSFSDLSRASVLSLQVESAHLFDSPLPSEARLHVAAGTPERSGIGRMTVPLRIDLPLDRLTLVATGKSFVGQAEVRIVASDDRGHLSPVPVLQVDLAADSRPAAGAIQSYEANIELRRRPHRLLVAVHDPASGALFGSRLDIEP